MIFKLIKFKICICLSLICLLSGIYLTEDNSSFSQNKFDIVLPLGPYFFRKILKINISRLSKFFGAKIIIVGNLKIKNEIKDICSICEFFDENRIYPGLTINHIKKFYHKEGWVNSKHKWYFQKFVKMSFSLIAKKKYYLIFDYDTIPINNFSLFNIKNGKPYFSYSCDSWRQYFKTMKKLFTFKNEYKYSYVCEHMMINTKIMLKLIKLIEHNKNLKGKYFYEKILDASEGQLSLFSEYDTYGTYVYNYYPNLYEYRHLRKSDDSWKYFSLDQEMFDYASQSYDTLRFEKLPDINSSYYILFQNKSIRKNHKAHEYIQERNYNTTHKYVDENKNFPQVLIKICNNY